MARLNKRLSPRKKSSASKKAADAKQYRNASLQEQFREHLASIGCFRCKKKRAVKLEAAHLRQRNDETDKKIRGMITYVVPSGRDKKRKKLLKELKKTAILCHHCHKLYDAELRGGEPVSWKGSFLKGGVGWSCWPQYVHEFLYLSADLENLET